MTRLLDLYVLDLLNRVEALAQTLLPPLDSPNAVYARLSDDAEGLEANVTTQKKDSRALAHRDGVEIPESNIFTDNDISASTNSRKPRPGFERLVAYVMQGQIKTVYAYSNSRLTRRPMELEILITLHRQFGLNFKTVVSGTDDLSTADGRMVARYKAVADAAEAERTSERVIRQKKARAESGRPLGTRFRTFGYTRDWEIIESEAEIVRDVFAWFIGGESKNSITNRLQQVGVLTPNGNKWLPLQTTRLLRTPKYAGIATYKGKVVGMSTVPAIIDEATYEAAQTSTGAKAVNRNTRVHLLSGILICNKCKAPMNGYRGGRGEARYRCDIRRGGCGGVSIKKDWIEKPILRNIYNNATFDAHEVVEARPLDNRLDEIDAQIEYVHKEVKDLADQVRLLNELRTRRSAVVREQAAVVESDSSVFDYLDDIEAADISVKRAILLRHVKHIFVMPVGKGRQTERMTQERYYFMDHAGKLWHGGGLDGVDPRNPYADLPDDVVDALRRNNVPEAAGAPENCE